MKVNMTTTDLRVIASISAHVNMELGSIAADCVSWCFGEGELFLNCKKKELYLMPFSEDHPINQMLYTRLMGCISGTSYKLVD